MSLAGRVLDQNDLAGAYYTAFIVARRDLHPRVQVHDVLAARRRVPVEIVLSARLAKHNPGRRQAFGELAASPLLGPFDLDVAEVRLALLIGVQVMDAHACSLSCAGRRQRSLRERWRAR